MNPSERKQYLLNKKIAFQKKLEIEKRESNLVHFLNNLNKKTDSKFKVVTEHFPLGRIVNPAAYNLPDFPKHLSLNCKTDQELIFIKKEFKHWISNQKEKNILIKNKFCLNTNDWIICSKVKFLEHFDVLFDELDIMYTIIFFPQNSNFINSFEFEFKITVFKGIIEESGEIKYYT